MADNSDAEASEVVGICAAVCIEQQKILVVASVLVMGQEVTCGECHKGHQPLQTPWGSLSVLGIWKMHNYCLPVPPCKQ